MAEDQHELDCSAVEKGVVSVEILNAKRVNGRATPYTKAEAIDRTRGKVEDQLNKNTSGRYVNPPYLGHPKTSDTTNKVGVSQIEKPMPLIVRRNSKEPITDTKDDAVSINKPAKAKVTPQRAFLLPSESVSTAEAKQTHVRGKSLQLDPSRPNRSRAHPRL
ncbi:uncharacterized protein LOC121975706 isoform X1 [Zingiber officinale]|nr:uncharacterized protein LOC121975706 isoform X1 [Zingiber officinale]